MEVNAKANLFFQQSYTALRILKRSRWRMLLVAAASLISLPILVVVSSLFGDYTSTWNHLSQTVLPHYISNSILLLIGVSIGTFLLGVSSAWVTSMCAFPGRRYFQWLLLLPMAMPAYIIAYTYTGLLDFAGPVQTWLRDTFSLQYGDYWFPQIRSLPGAVVMLSLVLYPYVYLTSRTAFLDQSRHLYEASRSLGHGPWQSLFKVSLPLARPAIFAGLSLVMMESLADYGTVEYFGLSTFTTGIFRTWFGFGELNTAAQLASLLLVFVFVLLVMEQASRKNMRFYASSSARTRTPIALTGMRAWLCILCCALPILFGFVLPCAQLLYWSLGYWQSFFSYDFYLLLKHSFLLAGLSALTCLSVALLLCYGKRLSPGKFEWLSVRIASMGYAAPGTVIAIGVLIPFAWLDLKISDMLLHAFSWDIGLILSGSLFALVFAYLVRFLSVSVQTLDAGLEKISPHVDESARSLGYRPMQVLGKIHFPLLRVSVLAAFIMVFVDVLKELPTTLILRPFNFNTLAVRAYELASDERLAEAALPALAILFIGLVPVAILMRAMTRPAGNSTSNSGATSMQKTLTTSTTAN